MFKKFIISYDHRVEKKYINKIINFLKGKNIDFEIVSDNDSTNDYPLLAEIAYQKFLSSKSDGMILICGTGIGMNIVANKFVGLRAVLANDEALAYFARRHENANVLVFGSGYDDEKFSIHLCSRKMLRILDIFICTEFEAGRHVRRLNQIRNIEKG